MGRFDIPKPAPLDPEIAELIGLNEIDEFAQTYAVDMARNYLYAIRDAGLWRAEEESLSNPKGFYGALRTLNIELSDFIDMCR
jgi:hypothetical protein